MIPILPLAAVLVCGALDAPASGGADAAVSCGLSLLVVAQCALVPVLFWNIPDRIPLRLALGRATREELLDAALPGWRCAEALGRLAKPGEKVLGWDVDKLRYYVAPSLATPLGDPRLFEALEGKKDAELADALERRSYRFLLLNLGSSRALIAARFGEKFLERQAVPVGMCEGIASFRVVRGGSASSPSRADPAAAGLD